MPQMWLMWGGLLGCPADSGEPETCAEAVAQVREGPVDQDCAVLVPTVTKDAWNVEIEWIAPLDEIVVAPAVADVDGDGNVEVVTVEFNNGSLLLIDGESGNTERTLSLSALGSGGPAIGDVDQDGEIEIVAFNENYEVVAFRPDGSSVWTSPPLSSQCCAQIALANLDGEGAPEVLAQNGVLDGATGALLSTMPIALVEWNTAPSLGDIDLDGEQEVIAGGGFWRTMGGASWQEITDHRVPVVGTEMNPVSAFSAIANLDGDFDGEVIEVMSTVDGTEVVAREPDGSVIWTWTSEERKSAPPAVADFDGDGLAEVVIANRDVLVMLESDGTEKWDIGATDRTSAAGPAGFDLNGDGAAEVIYADETSFRIIDGRTGDRHFIDRDHESRTGIENPVIADIDGDGSAEILVARSGDSRGLVAYGHATDAWSSARSMWNQHAFDATCVEDDGTIPEAPEPAWTVAASYRAAPPVVGTEPVSAPDLVPIPEALCEPACVNGRIRLGVQISNRGRATAPAETPIAVYQVDDEAGWTLLESHTLETERVSGAEGPGLVVEIAEAGWGPGGVAVVLDDDGEGVGIVNECDETNNTALFDGPNPCGPR